ncbi:hypothetical protein V5F53_20615 [Xanthobacter sp. V4C-4]|uniref:hypothetical protein n=1 Tax=Xanthobacter cornucopiae TaxID=3119924 RepID=UPI003726768D
MDLTDKLALLRHFTSGWAGAPVAAQREGQGEEAQGLVRVLNREGGRPPLVWCFNAKEEFPALAAGLGPDQPLYGLRSLNLVTRMEVGRTVWDEALGERYAALLLDTLADVPCLFGANCQAVPVMMQVVRRWLLAGRRCAGAIALEWQPTVPLPVPMELLFGAESQTFNPFLNGQDPTPRWRLMFARHRVGILPGRHGRYFRGAGLEALVAAVRQAGDAAPAAAPPGLRLGPVTLPDQVAAGGDIDIALPAVAGPVPDGLTLCHFWRAPDSGLVSPLGWQLADGSAAAAHRLAVTAPAWPGPWDLHLFPALPEHGPLAWRDHLAPAARTQVIAPLPPTGQDTP